VVEDPFRLDGAAGDEPPERWPAHRGDPKPPA
jgi:hypothetical protein